MRSFIQFLFLSSALLLWSTPFPAASASWNDSKVKNWLFQRDIVLVPGDIESLMSAEGVVESARLDDSGVRLIRFDKVLEGSTSAVGAIPSYAAVREVEDPNGDKYLLIEPLSPEEVERMRMEANGTPPEMMANMMSGMSDGMLMLGQGLHEELKGSAWGWAICSVRASGCRSGAGCRSGWA